MGLLAPHSGQRQGSSTADSGYLAAGKSGPHCEHINLSCKAPGALLMPSPSCLWTQSCSIIRSAVCLEKGRTEASGERVGLEPADKLDTRNTSPFYGRVEEMANGSCQHWQASSPLGSHSFFGPFLQFYPGKGGARAMAFQLGLSDLHPVLRAPAPAKQNVVCLLQEASLAIRFPEMPGNL